MFKAAWDGSPTILHVALCLPVLKTAMQLFFMVLNKSLTQCQAA